MAVFVAAAGVVLQPTPHSLAHTFAGAGDPEFNTWVMSWGAHKLSHPSHFFDANIFWPRHYTLTYSDSLLTLAPFFGLFRSLTGNPVLSANLVELMVIGADLASVYFLTRWLVGRWTVSVFAAVAFTFNAYTWQHMDQVQLESAGLLALAFLTLFRMLDRPTVLGGALVGLSTALVALTSPYYGAIWVVAAAVVIVVWAAFNHRRIGWRLGAAAVSGVGVGALLILPVAVPYLLARRHQNLTRVFNSGYWFHIRDLWTMSPTTWLYGDLVKGDAVLNEHAFFPGFSVIGLALVGLAVLVLRPRRRSHSPTSSAPVLRRGYTWLLMVAGVVGVLFAFGGKIGPLPGIMKSFYYHVPEFNQLGVTSRLAVVGLLALAVAAAAGLSRVVALAGPRIGAWIALCLCALVVMEVAAPVNHVPVDSSPATLAVYHELARLPEGPVAELPMVSPTVGARWNFVEDARMLDSSYDWDPMVNGVAPAAPAGYQQDVDVINSFPAPGAVGRLRRLGVRYVVLHTWPVPRVGYYQPAQAGTIVANLPAGASAHLYGNSWLVALG